MHDGSSVWPRKGWIPMHHLKHGFLRYVWGSTAEEIEVSVAGVLHLYHSTGVRLCRLYRRGSFWGLSWLST